VWPLHPWTKRATDWSCSLEAAWDTSLVSSKRRRKDDLPSDQVDWILRGKSYGSGTCLLDSQRRAR
jgi:hypothetical protein